MNIMGRYATTWFVAPRFVAVALLEFRTIQNFLWMSGDGAKKWQCSTKEVSVVRFLHCSRWFLGSVSVHVCQYTRSIELFFGLRVVVGHTFWPLAPVLLLQ